MGCVLQDRASQYGGPEDNFGRIAKLWSTYTGTVLDGIDVAMMMALLKVARIRSNKGYEDGYIDLAGYAACGAELAGKAETYRQFIEKVGEEYKKLRAEAEAQPEFKPGDNLLVTMPDGEDIRCIYVGESKNPGCCCVRYLGGDCSGDTDDTVPIDQLCRVPVSKAEGCEALVEKDAPLCGERCEEFIPGLGTCEGCRHAREQDAPQTPAALYGRIIANNPATFKARTPTGEELAELAEEEGHG